MDRFVEREQKYRRMQPTRLESFLRTDGKKFRTVLKKLRYRSILFARNCFFHQKTETPFLIIGDARTGTNLLASYLQSIENVSMGGEILSEKGYRGIRRSFVTRRAALRHVLWSLNGLSSTVGGGQVHIGHLDSHGLTLRDLRCILPSLRFLVLYRKSIADQYVSWLLASQTGRWVGSSSNARHTAQVAIDAPHFSDYVDQIRKKYWRVLNSAELNENATLVSYEELVQQPQEIFGRKVFPLLNLPASPIRTNLIRQNDRPLSDSVINYDEVRDLLENAVQDYSVDSVESPLKAQTTKCS